jgi:elongation factor P
MKKAQREGIAQVKMKNLVSGKVIESSFHSADKFEEADSSLQKLQAKYLYNHRGRFFFSEQGDPAKRFDLSLEQVGEGVRFLKPNTMIETLLFNGKIISISLPIKVHLRVTEAPPGVRGDRAQGGLKTVVLETGAQINVPLFVEQDDVIEVNTQTGEYTRRAE